MRISDWSSDVCSSDLPNLAAGSAVTGEGCDTLLATLDRRLAAGRHTLRFDLDLSDGAAIAWLYAHGEVLEREDDMARAHIRVALDPPEAARFERRFGTRPR